MLTYNRDKLVSRAIDSILAQTFTDFEYIIVDNGSSDQSGMIADNYEKKDSRIKVIHRDSGNIGSGRNAGLDAAEGEYITFIDDDDWCEPDYLEFLYNLAIEYNANMSICGAADKPFYEKQIYNTEEAVIELFWRKRFNVQFPTKLIDSTLFNNHRFTENLKYDDIELMPRIFAAANRIAYHGLPKYTFYRHSSNNSAWTTDHSLLTSETLDEYLHAYSERTKLFSNLFPSRASAWRYFEWSFMISMVEKIDRLGIKGCESQLRKMKRELCRNVEEFINCEWIQGFERTWLKTYDITNTQMN